MEKRLIEKAKTKLIVILLALIISVIIGMKSQESSITTEGLATAKQLMSNNYNCEYSLILAEASFGEETYTFSLVEQDTKVVIKIRDNELKSIREQKYNNKDLKNSV